MTGSTGEPRRARPPYPAFAKLRATYRGTAVVLLNVAILLVALEVVMTAAVALARRDPLRDWIAGATGRPNDVIAHYRQLSYYQEQPWSERYWDEHRAALAQVYRPYVVWRSPPFAGETLNIDEAGRRVTPGDRCGQGAYEVWTFGGSAMWGWGAPDWETLPAHLQRLLAAARGGPVCVVNLAENAHVSTQGLIQLVLELQRGGQPDLVLFYDGVNDVLAALQTGRPADHQNLSDIAHRFDSPGATWGGLLRRTHTAQVVGWLARRARGSANDTGGADGAHLPPDPDRLADAVAQTYLVNLHAAESLAERFGFELAFFWQPHILIGDKPLAPEERDLVDRLSWVLEITPRHRALFEGVHQRVAESAAAEARLQDLAGVFDGLDSPVWIDTWGHATPVGNATVARAMVATLAALAARDPTVESAAGAGVSR
jgi:lysophospholipase L1-like esterase